METTGGGDISPQDPHRSDSTFKLPRRHSEDITVHSTGSRHRRHASPHLPGRQRFPVVSLSPAPAVPLGPPPGLVQPRAMGEDPGPAQSPAETRRAASWIPAEAQSPLSASPPVLWSPLHFSAVIISSLLWGTLLWGAEIWGKDPQ